MVPDTSRDLMDIPANMNDPAYLFIPPAVPLLGWWAEKQEFGTFQSRIKLFMPEIMLDRCAEAGNRVFTGFNGHN
ncbi:unnamed protein product [Bursaphelenchus xylophilus]|uniref:(pine wood nematode) hypothetical protein n=1 Tax=Bursaphelenchus xylophilus TaxID=6326 RepID=A0A1I7S8W2_BURXY|nr:unnamed protein product [Bursaphelenchus xylophilus]CAG9085935.1 unnamed protein product [Bursaphelenchus xylophilus]